MRSLQVFIILVYCFSAANAQTMSPAKWSYATKKLNKTEAIVYLKATLDEGWHIYSTHQPDGGPVKTTITFEPSTDFRLAGTLKEPKPHTEFNDIWGIDVLSFEKTVIFQQKIKLTKSKAMVKGTVSFMVCDDHQCLPPDTVKFAVRVK